MDCENELVCQYCDPEKYVVYGICKACGNEINPSLIDFTQESFMDKFRRMSKDLQKNYKMKDFHARLCVIEERNKK